MLSTSMPYGFLERNYQSDISPPSLGSIDEQSVKAFAFPLSELPKSLCNFNNMYDFLSMPKPLDTNLEVPDMRRLSMSSESGSSDGLSSFLESAKMSRDTKSIKVNVPTSEHVAEIVGKQGCKIKSLRYSTKTYIQTPARDQEPVFTISGYPEDVERAKRRIEEAAEHFTKIRQGRENNNLITPQLGPNAVVRYVRVPLKYVGLVVGPKGHNIKRIQSETDTFIMTPARDKEPIFEIRGAPEKVAEAENKLQMYIAMRTGGMFDDPNLNLVDVDLKKPMLPPKQMEGFVPTPPSFGGNKTWCKPESNVYNFGSFGSTPLVDQQAPQYDVSRIDVDSGYSSPNVETRKELHNLKILLEQMQNMTQPQPQQQAYSNRWSGHQCNF